MPRSRSSGCLDRSTTDPLPRAHAANTLRTVVVVPAASARARASSLRLEEPLAALVIDSQPLFMDALATILQEPPLSATVTKCARSDEALEIARSQHFDVIFCEL